MNWDEAFRLIYKLAPQIREQDAPDGAFPLRVPWSCDQELSALPRSSKMSENPYIQLCTLLDRLEKQVSRNLPDFKAFSLSAKYLEHTFWRDQILTGPPLTREEAAALIKSIADRDRTLAGALSKDSDQSRFPDSPAKSAPLFGFEPKDQLLFQFQRAANYSASLTSHPARFHQLIAAAKHV